MAAASEAGVEPPAEVLEASDLWDVSVPYWSAFWALGPSRPLAVGMGGATYLPIPYGALSQYAADHGLADTTELLDEFVSIIQQMDAVYLAHQAERAKVK